MRPASQYWQAVCRVSGIPDRRPEVSTDDSKGRIMARVAALQHTLPVGYRFTGGNRWGIIAGPIDKGGRMMPHNTDKVTPKEERFLQAYIVSRNATDAAKIAGAAPKSASKWGSQALKRPRVACRLKALEAELLANSETSADRVITELERVAFANIADMISPEGVVEMGRLTLDQKAAIASYSRTKAGLVKVTLVDKMQGLDRLCKHLGLFEADNEQRAQADRDARTLSDTELARRVAFALRRAEQEAEPSQLSTVDSPEAEPQESRPH